MNKDASEAAVPTTLRGSVVALLWLAGVAAAAGTVLGFVGDRPWFMDLYSHFRLQYAAVLLAVSIGM